MISLKNNFPPFPSTPVLHSVDELRSFVRIEEKIDGSNCGMMLDNGHAVIRNRDHILKKGYLKDTPAKQQFRPAWTWFYDNLPLFERLNAWFDGPMGVYGEWVYALHGVEYNNLPAGFIAFDLWDVTDRKMLGSASRTILDKVGFVVPPLIEPTESLTMPYLQRLASEQSAFGTEQREGLYIRTWDEKASCSFKVIREGFVQGSRWDHRKLVLQPS